MFQTSWRFGALRTFPPCIIYYITFCILYMNLYMRWPLLFVLRSNCFQSCFVGVFIMLLQEYDICLGVMNLWTLLVGILNVKFQIFKTIFLKFFLNLKQVILSIRTYSCHIRSFHKIRFNVEGKKINILEMEKEKKTPR